MRVFAYRLGARRRGRRLERAPDRSFWLDLTRLLPRAFSLLDLDAPGTSWNLNSTEGSPTGLLHCVQCGQYFFCMFYDLALTNLDKLGQNQTQIYKLPMVKQGATLLPSLTISYGSISSILLQLSPKCTCSTEMCAGFRLFLMPIDAWKTTKQAGAVRQVCISDVNNISASCKKLFSTLDGLTSDQLSGGGKRWVAKVD